MARHRDAEKAQRQNLKHRSRNRNYHEDLKASLKAGRTAADKGDKKGMLATIQKIGRTASAGAIHKRKAARLISRLMKRANAAKA